MNPIQGTIKFVHSKGYGFVETSTGDVFLHVNGFHQPSIIFNPQPTLTFDAMPIDPNKVKQKDRVTMVVVEGEKGPMAERWWFTEASDTIIARITTMPLYRMVSRRTLTGKPFGDTIDRCWKVRQSLHEEEIFTGYLPQLRDFKAPYWCQLRIEVKRDDQWVACDCPLGQYHGGHLFDLPEDWHKTERVSA